MSNRVRHQLESRFYIYQDDNFNIVDREAPNNEIVFTSKSFQDLDTQLLVQQTTFITPECEHQLDVELRRRGFFPTIQDDNLIKYSTINGPNGPHIKVRSMERYLNSNMSIYVGKSKVLFNSGNGLQSFDFEDMTSQKALVLMACLRSSLAKFVIFYDREENLLQATIIRDLMTQFNSLQHSNLFYCPCKRGRLANVLATKRMNPESCTYMSYFDGKYYFYSNDTCYQTDEMYRILRQQKITFPYGINVPNREFRQFSNDYAYLFCAIRHGDRWITNVYDMLYEFAPFKATYLATIPNYPHDQKQNHKVISSGGRLFCTNGTQVYEYTGSKMVRVAELAGCQTLRLHTLNGVGIVRNNESNSLYVMGPKFQLIQVVDDYQNKDLLLGNDKYLLNYNERFCAAHFVNGAVVYTRGKRQSIQSPTDMPHILTPNGWDIKAAYIALLFEFNPQEQWISFNSVSKPMQQYSVAVELGQQLYQMMQQGTQLTAIQKSIVQHAFIAKGELQQLTELVLNETLTCDDMAPFVSLPTDLFMRVFGLYFTNLMEKIGSENLEGAMALCQLPLLATRLNLNDPEVTYQLGACIKPEHRETLEHLLMINGYCGLSESPFKHTLAMHAVVTGCDVTPDIAEGFVEIDKVQIPPLLMRQTRLKVDMDMNDLFYVLAYCKEAENIESLLERAAMNEMYDLVDLVAYRFPETLRKLEDVTPHLAMLYPNMLSPQALAAHMDALPYHQKTQLLQQNPRAFEPFLTLVQKEKFHFTSPLTGRVYGTTKPSYFSGGVEAASPGPVIDVFGRSEKDFEHLRALAEQEWELRVNQSQEEPSSDDDDVIGDEDFHLFRRMMEVEMRNPNRGRDPLRQQMELEMMQQLEPQRRVRHFVRMMREVGRGMDAEMDEDEDMDL